METRHAMAYLANGGKVPGKGNKDSVPAMLMPGEVVIPKDSVRKLGAGNLMAAIKHTHKPTGKPKHKGAIRMMADGGLVDEEYQRRQLVARPNFTIPGQDAPVRPTARLALSAPPVGTAVVPTYTPNFTMPSGAPAQAAPNPNVQDVRAKWNPASASPEARAFMAQQGAPAPTVAAPAAQGTGVLGQMNQGLRGATGLGEPPAGMMGKVTGALGSAGSGALRMLGRVAPYVGIAKEGADVARVAMDDNATGIDVATQAAQGAGRLGAAGAGAGAGAAIGSAILPGPGTVIGGLIGGGLGYYGADKAIESGRSVVGVDPRSPAGRLPASTTMAAVAAPSPRGASTPGTRQIPAGNSMAEAGRGTVNPPMAGTLSPQQQADGVTLTGARGSMAGLPVDGADGVRKLVTQDGRTLYSNVTGGDNDKLMSGKPGMMTVPAMAGVGNAPPTVGAGSATGAMTVLADTGGYGLRDKGYLASRAAGFAGAPAGVSGREIARLANSREIAAEGNATSRANNEAANAASIANTATHAEATRYSTDSAARSAMARLGLDAQTHAQDAPLKAAQAEGARQTVADKKRMDSLQTQYLAETDPGKREVLAGKIRGLQGKEDRPVRQLVVPGGTIQTPDGPVHLPSSVYDPDTGEFKTPKQGQAQAAPPPNHVAALKRDPKLAAQFDQQYGKGAAAKYLGAQ